MNNEFVSRRLMKKWHLGEKATIDHLVSALHDGTPALDARVHSAVTASGLFVEDQIRKSRQIAPGGLAKF